MDHGRPEEVELELLVPPEDLAALWRHPRVAELTRGPASVRTLESVYFDTGDLDLVRSGLVEDAFGSNPLSPILRRVSH